MRPTRPNRVTTTPAHQFAAEVTRLHSLGVMDMLRAETTYAPGDEAKEQNEMHNAMLLVRDAGWSLGMLDACLVCGSTEDGGNGEYAQLHAPVPSLQLYAVGQVCTRCCETAPADLGSLEQDLVLALVEQAREAHGQPERWCLYYAPDSGVVTQNDFLTRPGGMLENITKAQAKLGGGRVRRKPWKAIG